jgi:hypothetical protein
VSSITIAGTCMEWSLHTCGLHHAYSLFTTKSHTVWRGMGWGGALEGYPLPPCDWLCSIAVIITVYQRPACRLLFDKQWNPLAMSACAHTLSNALNLAGCMQWARALSRHRGSVLRMQHRIQRGSVFELSKGAHCCCRSLHFCPGGSGHMH